MHVALLRRELDRAALLGGTPAVDARDSHAMKPDSRSLPTVATALNLEIVAMLPLSKYLKAGCGSLPLILRSIWRAAYRAPWIATWATPGRWSSEAMSPTTNTSG